MVTKYKKCTVNELVKWYWDNADTKINIDFITYLIAKGIITSDNTLYSLKTLNDLLLVQFNGNYIKDENDKFVVKNNRKCVIEQFKNNSNTNKKYRLTSLSGNKLKLIKIK